MAEHKTSATKILAVAMRELLPPFHTVKVSLLDSVERVAVKKITTLHELNASVRTWIQTVRSRFQTLADTNPTFSAVVAHH
eukprot:1679570-Amphidinium_carterae.1